MIKQLLILISLSFTIPTLAQEQLKSSLEDKISKKTNAILPFAMR